MVDDLGFDADVDGPTLFASIKSRNRARIMELNMDNNKIGSKLNHVGRGHLQSLHYIRHFMHPMHTILCSTGNKLKSQTPTTSYTGR